jgi:hypothetical protein
MFGCFIQDGLSSIHQYSIATYRLSFSEIFVTAKVDNREFTIVLLDALRTPLKLHG